MSRKLMIITPTLKKDIDRGLVRPKGNVKCIYVSPWMESLIKRGLVRFPERVMTDREQELFKGRISCQAWKERQERKQQEQPTQ